MSRKEHGSDPNFDKIVLFCTLQNYVPNMLLVTNIKLFWTKN